MATSVVGKEYTVTATATNLTSILGGTRIFYSHMVFRAGENNAANVILGKSDITTGTNRLVYLKPKESFAIALEGPFLNSDDIFVIGTPSDIVHIMGLS